MISFDAGTHRFHFRAAVVVVEADHVLLHQIEGQDFWCLPGGRVEAGERAEQTVIREMREEVDAEISVGRMLWSVENFFSHDERAHHEIGLYFTAEFKPGSSMLDLRKQNQGVEGSKSLTFVWFPRDRLAELDLRPVFLRKLLAGNPLSPAHVVQEQDQFEIYPS